MAKVKCIKNTFVSVYGDTLKYLYLTLGKEYDIIKMDEKYTNIVYIADDNNERGNLKIGNYHIDLFEFIDDKKPEIDYFEITRSSL